MASKNADASDDETANMKPGEREKFDKLIARQVAEARAQLTRYAADENIQKRMHGAQLIKVVLVFRGWELVRRTAID